MEEKSSMLYWHPKIKNLDISQPRTIAIEFPECNNVTWEIFLEGGFPEEVLERIGKACDKFGYPVFIRTDMASGKHNWKDSCFVEKKENLRKCLAGVIEFNLIAQMPFGLPINAIFVREYIPMKNLFTAFWGEMPVNPEIRFFVKEGRVFCKHWYWIENSIKNPSVKNWKEMMSKEKKSLEDSEKSILFDKALKVANQFSGYWSVDFCKGADGKWYLIDMALGSESWHPKDCNEKEKK